MRLGVFLCVVSCLPALAIAQETAIPRILSLADALRLAAERNSSFAAAKNAIEAAEADRAVAARRPNPAVSVDSEGYRPGADSSGRGFLDKQELTVRFDQELELGGRRRLRIQAADAGIEVARLQARDRLRQLEFGVRRAYFEAVLARANREVANAALAEIDRVIGLNRARFEQGEISGADLRRLQVERLRFVDDTFQSELESRNAMGALLAYLNAPSLNIPIEVTEPLTRPAVEGAVLASVSAPAGALPASLFAEALAARPDVLAARQTVQRADIETRLQRALRAPSPTVGGGYRRDFGTGGLVVGMTVPLPLFNSLNAGGLARAEAERRRAQNDAVAVETAIRLDVQLATNAVEVNRARVAYIEREYLKAAQESRDIVLASYRIGEMNLIDFLDSQRAFRDTLRTYNRALFDARLSEFALDAAIGGSTPKSQ